MGADQGVLVTDDAIAGSDAVATSLVLAKAVEKIGQDNGAADLVVTGMASTDAGTSLVPAMLAERLGLPQVTFAPVVETKGDQIRAKRDGDAATEVIGATLPVRSEGRRGGKECFSTCRSRWLPHHKKKKLEKHIK